MPISDNNPERRNLVVTSFAFIVYFWGGGSIPDSEISIQAVSIKLTNLEVISVLSWMLLFWFALRYWQVCKDKLSQSLHAEVPCMKEHRPLIWYVKSKLKLPYREEGGVVISSVERARNGQWRIGTALAKGGRRDEGTGDWIEFQAIAGATINPSDLWGLLVRISMLGKLSIVAPGIGSWFFPYVLFVIAVISGLIEIQGNT